MLDLGNDGTRIRRISVRSYNLKQLAAIYDISKYLMRNKLKRHKEKIGEKFGYSYEVDQVLLIFRLIPLPHNVRVVQYRKR